MKINSCVPMAMALMAILTASTTTSTTPKPTTTTPRTTTTTPRTTTTTPKTTTTTPRTTTTTPRTTKPTTTRTTAPWTTGSSGLNLNGKMFTLMSARGGVAFSPPGYPPYYTTRPPSTPGPWTPRPSWTTRPPWTTSQTPGPAGPGVSVCVRYLSDVGSALFTLSPSNRNPLELSFDKTGGFSVKVGHDYYDYVHFTPNLKFWWNMTPDLWTRVCLTVDSSNNVAQMFSGSYISIRKFLPVQYTWSGEAVVEFSNFEGQVTDVQVWDYPLHYGEVFNYMTNGVFRPYRGSALSWSSVSFSSSGQTLLEDTFERQAKQPISNQGRRPRLRGKKKTMMMKMMMKKKFSNEAERGGRL